MSPATTAPKKTENELRLEEEREELLKIRAACWDSQKSHGKTGTADFLNTLIAVHDRLMELDSMRPGKAATTTPAFIPTPSLYPINPDPGRLETGRLETEKSHHHETAQRATEPTHGKAKK